MNTSEKIKWEPLRDANLIGGWQFDFTEAFKKLQERQKYDEVWELIKEKNNW
jgi:hypothetical protein